MVLVSNTPDGRWLARKLKINFFLIKDVIYPDSERPIRLSREIRNSKAIIYYKFNAVNSVDQQVFNLLVILQSMRRKVDTKLILPYLPYCRSYPVDADEIDKLIFI